MSIEDTNALKWAKFIVGAFFFGALLYVHLFVHEISLFLLAVPGLLMGIDVTKYLPTGGKK